MCAREESSSLTEVKQRVNANKEKTQSNGILFAVKIFFKEVCLGLVYGALEI
jgi:hypothetical protein